MRQRIMDREVGSDFNGGPVTQNYHFGGDFLPYDFYLNSL